MMKFTDLRPEKIDLCLSKGIIEGREAAILRILSSPIERGKYRYENAARKLNCSPSNVKKIGAQALLKVSIHLRESGLAKTE